MANFIPEFTGNIKDFIRSKDYSPISYHNAAILQLHGNISYPVYNIFIDYMDELEKISLKVRLNDEEFDKYQYKPRILAYDLYGSTELYFLIMIMNKICDEKDFNFKLVTIIDPSKLGVINDILLAEDEYINDNHYFNE